MANRVTLLASFYAQAAHEAYTSNRAYGKSINFLFSLTNIDI